MDENAWSEKRIKQQSVIQEQVTLGKKLLDELSEAYPELDEVIDRTRHMKLTFTRNICQDLANQIDAYVTLVDKEKDAILGIAKPEHPKSTNVKGRGYKLIEAGVTSPWVALRGSIKNTCLAFHAPD